MYVTLPFAVLGYVFRKLDCEPAPLLAIAAVLLVVVLLPVVANKRAQAFAEEET